MNILRSRWLYSLLIVAMVAAACSQPADKQDPAAGPVLISERLLVREAWDEFSWSPDGTRMLLSRWDYEENTDVQPQQIDAPVAIAYAESGDVQLISQTGIAPQWSPNGESILLRSAGNAGGEEIFLVYSVDSGQISRLQTIPNTYLRPWLESGLFYQDDKGLERVEILGLPADGTQSGQPAFSEPELQLAYDGSEPGRSAAPSPDGKTFLLIDSVNLANRRWWLVQPDGRQVEMVHPLYSLGTCCAWSRDSKRLAFFGLAPEQGLYIIESSGNNLHRLVSASQMGEGAFLALDFSPDGKWIAFTWAEAGEGFPFDRNQIYVVGVDGRGLQQLTVDNSHPHNWLRWSQDGRYIAFKGRNRDIWLAEVLLP